jgi:putative inorganic carbon (HCO3(-)) transporter
MRTFLVLATVALGAYFSFQGAFYVLLFYLWNAYFRPEEWVWSPIIYALRLSLVVGVALVLTTAFSRERFRFGLGPAVLLAMLIHTTLSATFAPLGPPSMTPVWSHWELFAKVLLVSYFIMVLVTNEQRLRLALIVITLSLGLEGAKQGWVQLLYNPVGRNINGWPSLGDNNAVAVGMLMLVPLLLAFGQMATTRFERFAIWFLSIGILFRALFTYSRGGFLAALALAIHYALRSKHKVRSLTVVAITAAAVLSVMPDEYWDRMSTVRNAAETTEASRIMFWEMGLEMARDSPIFGLGIEGFSRNYGRYDTTLGMFGQDRNVHSTWVGLAAELGFPGLCLFLVVIANVVLIARRVRSAARTRPELTNLARFATAFEAQAFVFAVGGTFITLQYREFMWHIFALAVAVDYMVRETLGANAKPRASARPVTGPAGPHPGGVPRPAAARSRLA